MDDINNPGGSQGTPPNDEGMTRRMDTPAGGIPGQPDYGTPQYGTPAPQYGAPAPQYEAPAQPQQAYPYNQPPAQPQQTYPYNQPPAQPPAYVPPTTAPQQYQYTPPQQYNTVPGGGYNPTPGSGMSSYAANPPIKDPMTAMVIEIVGGLLGFMGVGNMLAGRLVPGLILLVSWWVIIGVGFTLLTVATCGLGICLVIPLWLAGPILSGFYLRGEMTGQPLFRR